MSEELKLNEKEGASSIIAIEPLDAQIKPFLSIAIPTYKRIGLLRETLDSVFKLKFSFPVEILVVDNDPTPSLQLMKDMNGYRSSNFIYYKNTENLGMFGNWNQCLNLAKGKYVTILHDDDLLLPDFATQLNKIHSENALSNEIAAFAVGILDQRNNRVNRESIIPRRAKNFLKYALGTHGSTNKTAIDLFFSNPFCGTLGIVMNRQIAVSLQGFNKDWYPVSDYEFWCRWTSRVGPIQFINKRVGLYRVQQNESLREDVRKRFVTGSTEIRYKMVAENSVPYYLIHLIHSIAWFQERAIKLDWRTKSDPNPLVFKMVLMPIWRKLVSVLSYFAKRAESRAGRI